MKYGITDNVEINLGALLINSFIIGASYSKDIGFARIGVSATGGFLWFLPDNPGINEKGIAFTPRMTIGNEKKNMTIGFTSGTISSTNYWLYGGYLGAQKKFKERWTISGELCHEKGLCTDTTKTCLCGDHGQVPLPNRD